MIKRVEVNYRGIFQKNLGKKIGSDIVMIASRMGRRLSPTGATATRRSATGSRASTSLSFRRTCRRRSWRPNAAPSWTSTRPTSRVVLDETMCKGVEPWGWHGVRPINEKVVKDGCLLVVSNTTTSCSSSSARSRTSTGWRPSRATRAWPDSGSSRMTSPTSGSSAPSPLSIRP